MKKYVILLATEDTAVEAVVKAMGTKTDWELKPVKTSLEVVSMVMDGTLSRSLAVVDLDLHGGARGLLTTMGGTVPVIAIAHKTSPWLSSLLQHHRIEATLTKPVTAEALRNTFERVQSMSEVARGN